MHEQGRTHQVARESGDELHGIVLLGDFDEPRIGPAWPCELRPTRPQPEHKDLCLYRSLDRPGRPWRHYLIVGDVLAKASRRWRTWTVSGAWFRRASLLSLPPRRSHSCVASNAAVTSTIDTTLSSKS